MTMPLLGQMMDVPLTVSSLLAHAARHFGTAEIVSRRIEGDIHRYTYRDCERRAKQLAQALIALGVQPGERVATLAWNGYRHLETYYGTTGFGAVCHTINPRLFPDQIAYIVNHADDAYVLFDTTFAPLVDGLAPQCPKVRGWIALADEAHLPAMQTPVLSYETLVNAHDGDFEWPPIDERQASYLCYTSGTTGNPKGALYSHRSTVLHAFGASLPDAMALSARDSVLPVVPMFHVNAWGIPHAAPLTGAKLVFPGKDLDGKSLFELMERERVTYSAGVPTVWLGLLNYLRESGSRFSSLERTVIGGSACPPAMLRSFVDDYGVQVIHAWGMTEMSPLGTLSKLTWEQSQRPVAEQRKLLEKQGHALYGVDMKIVGDDGQELPWDGVAFGDLYVRGPWVIDRYFRKDDSPLVDGWFPTGDVATIDHDGFLQITDRSKDVIKSGGEWISSIDVENVAIAHPAVAEAACIACAHPKWTERPLLVVVKRAGLDVTRDELLAFYNGKVAKWWIPDDVVFVDELPHTATGKLQKLKLRDIFRDHVLPSALEDRMHEGDCPLARGNPA
ncbi:fatty-acyl-CoA synthase [Paraburkholderia sp. GV068]|jgi:acyl-CoA synthetase (AMP-forming)/AMP-acid ligase II|uniref:Acyl-CoA synthetase (AMP-forming)/AMP-acid ligase II n=1 Tax=Paraburkholderia graminis TaxID=60548 RepID=A0ABD5CMV5_9BURK|nr:MULTISPECIES: 3-(methylthio)propionyl-CoA ligase [Paraburkholderia]MDQ0623139.1 acyl-CoA synthetase (AMP-forming)/AMP-acid ligase II [Paraburkholderia graminis]MDR6206659.1 acyl-CoA synthetase (AMP-forming)/AMP-acid ligase II [Paraburkholderia graminis]PTR00493.1 fatty-acyl-CoA synthase [Paraburkholderia sp. GV072]PUB05342.1 fatty-acyl-CoA synthase [Paraburkholderia sp. GV068]